MVQAEALVLLEEEVEEEMNPIQITLPILLPVSAVDEVHLLVQELESFVPDLKDWLIKKEQEAPHSKLWRTTSTSNHELKIGC